MKLNQQTLSSTFRPVPNGFDQAMQKAYIQISHGQTIVTGTRPVKRLSFAAILVLALLIAAIGIAAIISGGVIHFNDEYITDHESAIESEVQSLVQYNVAHYDFGHVTMDVEQSVYDGQELRVVYSFYDQSVQTPYPDNPWQTLDEMTGLEIDGLLSTCDNADIDGQPLIWENERISGTDIPGKVLFYKRATLKTAGITPPSGKFTVTMYVLKGATAIQPQFVLDSSQVAAHIKTGTAKTVTSNGLTCELVEAVFTPLRGTLTMRFSLEGASDGDATRFAADGWLMGNNLYLPNGTALQGYMEGYDPEHPVIDVVLLFDAPQSGWPESLTLKATSGDKMEVTVK